MWILHYLEFQRFQGCAEEKVRVGGVRSVCQCAGIATLQTAADLRLENSCAEKGGINTALLWLLQDRVTQGHRAEMCPAAFSTLQLLCPLER